MISSGYELNSCCHHKKPVIMQSCFFIHRVSICSPDKSILLQVVVFSRLTAATMSLIDYTVLILKWLFTDGVTQKGGRYITIFPLTCMCASFMVSIRNLFLLLLVVLFLGVCRLQDCVLEMQLCRTMNNFVCRALSVWTEDTNMSYVISWQRLNGSQRFFGCFCFDLLWCFYTWSQKCLCSQMV